MACRIHSLEPLWEINKQIIVKMAYKSNWISIATCVCTNNNLFQAIISDGAEHENLSIQQ